MCRRSPRASPRYSLRHPGYGRRRTAPPSQRTRCVGGHHGVECRRVNPDSADYGLVKAILETSGTGCVLEDGAHVPAETSRRLACDASRVVMRHDEDGRVLEVGARTRTIPPALRRALHHRDHGCRFPGCRSRFTQGHHLRHWAQGGPTTLSNLALLCRRHLAAPGLLPRDQRGQGAERGPFASMARRLQDRPVTVSRPGSRRWPASSRARRRCCCGRPRGTRPNAWAPPRPSRAAPRARVE